LRAPLVGIKCFYLEKVIKILVVVAYKRYCKGKIVVRISDINEWWLIIHDSGMVIWLITYMMPRPRFTYKNYAELVNEGC